MLLIFCKNENNHYYIGGGVSLFRLISAHSSGCANRNCCPREPGYPIIYPTSYLLEIYCASVLSLFADTAKKNAIEINFVRFQMSDEGFKRSCKLWTI